MDIIDEAKTLGWHDKEQHIASGRPEESWVDAETFVEKGRHIFPILRENNQKLKRDMAGMAGKVAALQTSLNEAMESMEAMKSFHTESTKAQVQRARADLLAELKAAKSEGDVDAEVEATSRLSKFDAVSQVAPPPVANAPLAPPPPQLAPEFVEWHALNPWYGVDAARSGLMDGICRGLRIEGNQLVGKDFLQAAQSILEAREGGWQRQSRVEGSTPGTPPSGRTDYNALPAEAKEYCDLEAKRLVGPNRAYKNQKEWREYYATEYFKRG